MSVIVLRKSAAKRVARAALDVDAWNRTPDGIKHPKDERGRWADTPALTGKDALDSVPARLKRAPGGRHGNYEGEELFAPEGHGDVRPLSYYEGLEYQRINGFLRGDLDKPVEIPKWFELEKGPEAVAKRIAEHDEWAEDEKRMVRPMVREIDKTMDVSPLPHDIEVERIIRFGKHVWGEDIWYGDMNTRGIEDFDEQDRRWARWEAGERPDLTGLEWEELAYVSTTSSDTFAEHHGRHWTGGYARADGEPVIMRIRVMAGTKAIQLSEHGEVGEILLQHGMRARIDKDHGVDSKGFRRVDVRMWPADDQD